jgi:hypothetical protein
MPQLHSLWDHLPSSVKFACDFAAVSTAFTVFFAAVATPLAALASLAALVYTVLRGIHLIKHWSKP